MSVILNVCHDFPSGCLESKHCTDTLSRNEMKESGYFNTPAALITGKKPQLTHGTEIWKGHSVTLDVLD
jgi:hypothetical protein